MTTRHGVVCQGSDACPQPTTDTVTTHTAHTQLVGGVLPQATYKFISGRVLTCVSAHLSRLYSVATSRSG